MAKLHAELEESAASRGAKTGGLGFDAKGAKAEKAAAKALNRATSSHGGSKKREFAATTAGAVAAGHWDPWARPVEYELKKVNRTAGNLSSMFVKGETMGGTIEDKTTLAVPKTDHKWSGPKKDKKEKKAISADGATAQAKAAPVRTPSAEAFNWKKAIKAELRAANGCKVKTKALRRAVCDAFEAHAKAAGSKTDLESTRETFKKKLKKLEDVTVADGEVSLGKAK